MKISVEPLYVKGKIKIVYQKKYKIIKTLGERSLNWEKNGFGGALAEFRSLWLQFLGMQFNFGQ